MSPALVLLNPFGRKRSKEHRRRGNQFRALHPLRTGQLRIDSIELAFAYSFKIPVAQHRAVLRRSWVEDGDMLVLIRPRDVARAR